MSTGLQHLWAWLITGIIVVGTCIGIGLAIYMRWTGYISKRRMWRHIDKEIDK